MSYICLLDLRLDLLLLAGPAVAEAVDEAGGDAEIVLAFKGEERVHEARALIVSSDAEGERAAEGAFDASAEGIREASFIALEFSGWGKGDRAVDPGRADEGVHEDSGFTAVLEVIDRADQGGEHVVAVVGAGQDARMGEGEVESRAPARSEMQQRTAVNTIEVDPRRGGRGHAHEDVSAAGFENGKGPRGAVVSHGSLFYGSLREKLCAECKKEKQ